MLLRTCNILEADKVLNEGGGNDYSTSSENNLEKAAREDANGFIKAFRGVVK